MSTVLTYVFFVAIACVFLACDLKPTVRSNEGTLEPKAESVEELVLSEATVAFEGVSFSYDPRVFGDVKKEVVPERKLEDPTHKPDFATPEYISFEFELGKELRKARIAVYSLDDFDDAFAVSPPYVKYLNENIANLKKVLKDPTLRFDRQIPHLEYADASDDFYVKVRKFNFPSGSGIIFVKRWSIEADLISNQNLIYRFEGITSDGKSYLTAETPVRVAFLPEGSPDEFEGYTHENLYKGNASEKAAEARIDEYIRSISTRLEKLGLNEYTPNLEKFEAIISSLKIDSGQSREQ